MKALQFIAIFIINTYIQSCNAAAGIIPEGLSIEEVNDSFKKN